jgi:hypothetical protein
MMSATYIRVRFFEVYSTNAGALKHFVYVKSGIVLEVDGEINPSIGSEYLHIDNEGQTGWSS